MSHDGRCENGVQHAYARALSEWQDAELVASDAEAAVAGLRAQARLARLHAAERRARAECARAARQPRFAQGLLDSACAHEQAAREAEVRAAEAERQALPFRAAAADRLREVSRTIAAGQRARASGSWG
jgi:hypothetical protein